MMSFPPLCLLLLLLLYALFHQSSSFAMAASVSALGLSASPVFPVVHQVNLSESVLTFTVMNGLLYWMAWDRLVVHVQNASTNQQLPSIDLAATVRGQGLSETVTPVLLQSSEELLFVSDLGNQVLIVFRPNGQLVTLYYGSGGILTDPLYPSPDAALYVSNLRPRGFALYNASARTAPDTPPKAIYIVILLGRLSNPVIATIDGLAQVCWVQSFVERTPRMELLCYALRDGVLLSNTSMPAGQLVLEGTTWISALGRTRNGTFVLAGGDDDGLSKPLCFYQPQATTRSTRLQCQQGLTRDNADNLILVDENDRVWTVNGNNNSQILVYAQPIPLQPNAPTSTSGASVASSSYSSASTSPSSSTSILSSLSSATSTGGSFPPSSSSTHCPYSFSSSSPCASASSTGSARQQGAGAGWSTLTVVLLIGGGAVLMGVLVSLLVFKLRSRTHLHARHTNSTPVDGWNMPMLIDTNNRGSIDLHDKDRPLLQCTNEGAIKARC